MSGVAILVDVAGRIQARGVEPAHSLVQLVYHRRTSADPGDILTRAREFRRAVGRNAVRNGGEQRFDLALASIEPLRNEQTV